MSWHFVGIVGNDLWAVLDNNVESLGWELLVLHSTDQGATWVGSEVRKVSYWAHFEGFRMSSSGHGRLTIRLDDEYPPHPVGAYHYRTEDHGVVWSEAEWEANELEAAESDSTWQHASTRSAETWRRLSESVPEKIPAPEPSRIETVTWTEEAADCAAMISVVVDPEFNSKWLEARSDRSFVVRLPDVVSEAPLVVHKVKGHLLEELTVYHDGWPRNEVQIILTPAEETNAEYSVTTESDSRLVIRLYDDGCQATVPTP